MISELSHTKRDTKWYKNERKSLLDDRLGEHLAAVAYPPTEMTVCYTVPCLPLFLPAHVKLYHTSQLSIQFLQFYTSKYTYKLYTTTANNFSTVYHSKLTRLSFLLRLIDLPGRRTRTRVDLCRYSHRVLVNVRTRSENSLSLPSGNVWKQQMLTLC